MIYFQNEKLLIIGNAGDVKIPEFHLKFTLLKCQSIDRKGRPIVWRLKEYLRAGGGWTEIMEKSASAPYVYLNDDELRAAITEARSAFGFINSSLDSVT